MIRNATLEDAAAIAGIYNHYIGNTVVTFEEQPVPTDDMRDRVADVIPKWPWLVFEENDAVIGYAYATQWNKRGAYRHSVESSVYLSPTATGRGIGRALYERLIAELRTREVHVVIGGVSLPNPASVALHEKLGFKKVAHFKEVGNKFGRWIDVGYWQLILAKSRTVAE